MPVFISNKVNFKAKNLISDREGNFIMIKGSILQEDMTVLNVYTPKKNT